MKANNGTFGGDGWEEEDLKNVEQPVLIRAIRRTDKRSIPFTGEGRRPRDPEEPEDQEEDVSWFYLPIIFIILALLSPTILHFLR